MSSLITKVNKSRSLTKNKLVAKKGKKGSAKKPQRPGTITATPKSKRPAIAKSRKVAPIARKATGAKAKKPLPKKSAASKTTTKVRIKTPAKAKQAQPPVKRETPSPKQGMRKRSAASRAAARAAVRASRALPKPLPAPPKKPPTPNALAAVRTFEQALKVFNRHDYREARSAFNTILEKFADQAEVTAGARTYLAICEQRLSRLPSVPRDAESLYDQGVFEFNRGNTREAIDLYDKALRADPRADHVLYSLAAAYARLTNPSKALEALRRAITFRAVLRSHARRDLDFANLRSNPEFRQLTGFGFELSED